MRPLRLPRRLARPAAVGPALTALILASLLLPAVAGAVNAKEGLMAAFDAPIAFDTPPGTELLVGMTVTALTEDGEVPVQGSPIVLILTGREGTSTEAHGVEDVPGSGHYVARITVPPGGARDARVVMRGGNSEGRVDIDLWITTDPFTFGGVTGRTAQVAPAPTPGLTPFPQATAAPQAPAAASPAAAPAAPVPGAAAAPDAAAAAAGEPGAAAAPVSLASAAPAPVDSGVGGPAWWPAALAGIAMGLAVVVGMRLRVARRATQDT